MSSEGRRCGVWCKPLVLIREDEAHDMRATVVVLVNAFLRFSATLSKLEDDSGPLSLTAVSTHLPILEIPIFFPRSPSTFLISSLLAPVEMAQHSGVVT